MKEKIYRNRKSLGALVLTVLLIVSGLVMVSRVSGQYEEIILENEDDQLYGLARSVDRSIQGYLRQYTQTLRYAVAQRRFAAAEARYLNHGEVDELLRRLEEDMVPSTNFNVDILCLREGALLFSVSGREDYVFSEAPGPTGAVSVRTCLDGEGGIYMAFVGQSEAELTYAILIDLEAFYTQVAGDLTAGTKSRILLLDAGEEMVLHQGEDGIRVELIEDVPEGDRDRPGITFLLGQQWLEEEGATFYTAKDQTDGGTQTVRMATVPAAGHNGVFSVGVAMNYDTVTTPMRRTAIQLTVYTSMAIAGILLLAILFARKNSEAQRELEILQKKNAAMEELNRQTQELAHHQRLETIGTLTSSIAHEFNNLLTPIMGYSILALEQVPEDKVEVYDSLLEIYNASRKAKDIISRLSDLSRKNTALTFQYVAPDQLVGRVLEVAQPVKPGRVNVVTELACRHVWLYGNDTQLSQLLLNLILNAFQAMGKEGGTLTVSTAMEGEEIVFRVSDTGPGIGEEVLPHIFEPFFTTKEGGRGTGLGLAIVQQVVEEHKGTVQVDTAPGAGTTFTVRFPLATREE